MKKLLFFIVLSLMIDCAKAQNAMWIYNSDGTISSCNLSEIDSLAFNSNMIDMFVYRYGTSSDFAVEGIDSIVFKPVQDIEPLTVYIDYYGEIATVRHDIDSDDFIVDVDGADVYIVSQLADNLQYYLSGFTSDGSFSLESDSEYTLVLNGVDITSSDKVPLDLSNDVERNIIIANGSDNILSDNADSDGKAVVKSKGATNISGYGTLTINANKKHGITSDNDITILGATITINHSADASKGLKSDANVTIMDGEVSIVSSGTIVLEELGEGYDPSYCSAIGADNNFEMIGGCLDITLPESNVAGRGIKVDGDISVIDGRINILSQSGGDTYTNSDGEIDSYKSSCIKADGNIYFSGGEIVLEATGSAGKCVNADGDIYIGNEEGDNDIVMNLKTYGVKVYESGYGEDADYANPKALQADGNLYVYGGDIDIYTENDGGEGLESKDCVYILGGNITIDTYDDAINATNHIQIDCGTVYARSRGNDAIDSNGTITINGGFVVAQGTNAPEGSFDCDNNTFTITGGVVVGIGGQISNPTSSVCTQHIIVYNGITNGTALQIVDADGNDLLTFQVPNYSGGGPGGGPGGGGGLTLLFTSSELQEGTIVVKQGGSISGGEEFYGYFEDAEYSGETSSQEIEITEMVTVFGDSPGPF